jgi:hypothetical protein
MAATNNVDLKQFEKLFSAFAKNIKSLDEATGLHVKHIKSAFKKAVNEQISQANDLSYAMKGASKSFHTASKYIQSESSAINKAFEEYSQGINRANSSFSKLDVLTKGTIRQQASYTASLIEGIDYSNDAQDKLVSSIYKNMKAFDLITRQSDKVINSAWEMERSISKLASDVGVFERMMRETNGKVKEQIDNLIKKEAIDKESLTLGEREILQVARRYEMIGKENSEIKGLISETKTQITNFQKLAATTSKMIKVNEWINDKFGVFGKLLQGSLSPLGRITEGFVLLLSAVKGSWDQFKIIADSGMINSFAQIKKSQFQLGVSFELATKIFTENARLVGTIGGDKFVKILRTGQMNLEKFGLAPEQAAEAISDFTKNTIKSGINARDASKLNKAILAQTQAFGKLRATTGINMAEFKAMNDELLNSASVQEQLNGISEDERQSKIEDMMKLRQTFTNMGMSAQSAQKALLAIQDIGKQKVTERFDQAAKLQQAAAIAGLSNAKQLGDIYRKGKRATADEQLILQKSMGNISQVFDRMSMQSFGAENIANVLTDNMQGPLASMLDAGREQKLGAQSVGEMSDKTAQALTELSKLPDILAKALHSEGQLKQIITDPMLRGLAGIALVITGLYRMLPKILSPLFKKRYDINNKIASTADNELAQMQHINEKLAVDAKVQNSINAAVKTMAGKNSSIASKKTRWVSDRKKTGRAGISAASKIEEAISTTSSIIPAAEKGAGALGKIGGIFSKIFSFLKSFINNPISAALGKVAKLVPVVGEIATIMMGAISIFTDMFNASDVLGIEEGTASVAQKLVVGIGSLLKFITFGFLDDTIDDWTKTVANIDFAGVWLQIEAAIINPISKFYGFLQKTWVDVKGTGSEIFNIGKSIIAGWVSGVSGIKSLLTNSFVSVFSKISDAILGAIDMLPDFLKEKLPEGLLTSISNFKTSAGQFATQVESDFDNSVDDIRKVNKTVQDERQLREQEKKKIDAEVTQTIATREAAIDAHIKQQQIQQKQKQTATAVADQSKQTQQAVVEATNQATDATIDTAKALGMTAWSGLNAANLNGGTTASATIIGKGINSNLLNTSTNGATSSINNEVQTIKLDADTIKALAEQLITLNTTASSTLEVEKQQVDLLEKLVKANSPMQKMDEVRIRERHISDPFMSSSKWVSHQKQ